MHAQMSLIKRWLRDQSGEREEKKNATQESKTYIYLQEKWHSSYYEPIMQETMQEITLHLTWHLDCGTQSEANNSIWKKKKKEAVGVVAGAGGCWRDGAGAVFN